MKVKAIIRGRNKMSYLYADERYIGALDSVFTVFQYQGKEGYCIRDGRGIYRIWVDEIVYEPDKILVVASGVTILEQPFYTDTPEQEELEVTPEEEEEELEGVES